MGAKGIRLEELGDVKDALAEALAYNDGPIAQRLEQQTHNE